MQANHQDKAPGWTAVVTQRLSINCRMTSLAMKRGYRFESMQSSGMLQITLQDTGRYTRSLLNWFCNSNDFEGSYKHISPTRLDMSSVIVANFS
jgi:hypothetical protein